MNRIQNTFQKLKKTGKKAFIVYLTSGYPDLETTEKLVLEMAERGSL
jgi:tryptophan synthase alpha chain